MLLEHYTHNHSLSIGCSLWSQRILASGWAKALQLKVTDSPSVMVTLCGPSLLFLNSGAAVYINDIKMYRLHCAFIIEYELYGSTAITTIIMMMIIFGKKRKKFKKMIVWAYNYFCPWLWRTNGSVWWHSTVNLISGSGRIGVI